ncbi:morphogenic membrane protein MmpB [Streptomyces fradiae]
MLWSDPEDEPPKDMREMQAMLQRAGLVIGLALVVWMFLIAAR